MSTATGVMWGARGGAAVGSFGGPIGAAAGAVIGGIIGGLAITYGAEWIAGKIGEADSTAERDLADADTDTCSTCPCQRNLVISRAASPLAAQHIEDAQAAGQPSVLTYDPAGTTARRAAAMAASGLPTAPGMDRDEYPPATFLEGGATASVRHVPRSDNRSAGGQMSAQLRGATPGCKITMSVGP